jgi:hypothetical protein
MTTIPPPVVPRTERLPLENLGWDAFESFCRDLVSRTPGVRDCHHFGKQGDTQLGIDLFADFESGSRWAFQNKRWKEFGPADVEKAVQATTYAADCFVILLSREATAGVRNAVAKHTAWDIWDVRDLSQKVRELPLEAARRLLDQHLGAGVRRAFLGVSAVGTFLAPEEFFGPLENPARLFHHCWAMVGRADLLGRLDAFAGSATKRVAVLSGRGGIGKSKLLHAFARSENTEAGHAVRFLAEGMPVTPDSFDDLPLAPCVVVVDDAHRRWVREPGAHGHAHSPLDVLDQVFAKSGHGTFAEGHGIVFRPFVLSSDDTQDIRNEALAVVRSCAFADAPTVALRAVGSLQTALSGPVPFFNMTFTAADMAQWEPEQLRILGVLADLRGRTTDPVVHLRISEAVDWHARYAGSREVRERARAVARACPDHLDVRLARSLIVNHDLHDHADFDEDRGASFDRLHERQAEFRRVVAEGLWRSNDLQALVVTMNRTLKHLTDCGRRTNAGSLLDALLQLRPEQTEAVAEAIVADPASPLAGTFGFALTLARRRDALHAVALARRALATGDPTLGHAVAGVYCWSVDWAGSGFAEDVAVLTSLLAHADQGIRGTAVGSLRGMGRVRPRDAFSLARSVELGDSGGLADELFAVFHDGTGVPRSALSDDDLDALLGKPEGVDRLRHHVTEFLAFAAGRMPRRVVDLLLARVERGEREYDRDFEPMPYLGLRHSLAGLADAKEYEALVREVRNRSMSGSARGSFWFPKLFEEVSLRFSPASLKALTEWIGSGDGGKIAAATALLKEAPAAFVFEQQAFVTDALTKAHAVGEECFSRARWNLRHCATAHGRQKAGAGPFPQDVKLRDRAAAACRSLRRGTPEYKFYESLVKEAEGNIRDTRASDQEVDD